MRRRSPFLVPFSILIFCAATCVAQTQPAVSQLAGADSSLEAGTGDLRKSLALPRELFKLVEKGDEKHFEIRKDQFDKDYLLSATIDKGTGLWRR